MKQLTQEQQEEYESYNRIMETARKKYKKHSNTYNRERAICQELEKFMISVREKMDEITNENR